MRCPPLLAQENQKADTLVTRDEVVSNLRGTTLVCFQPAMRQRQARTAQILFIKTSEILLLSFNGDDPGPPTRTSYLAHSTASSGVNFHRFQARRLAAGDLLSLK